MVPDPAGSPALSRLSAALADRYRIERELGAGGMATVYLARDLKHDRDVALKVLRPELAAVLGAERFLNEIKITARLDHVHILTLIDSGSADGALYYVVPFVRGESLRERLTKEGQLPLEEALRLASQVASALDHAHRQGVIHRDIKPENILLQDGEVLLADFGIALALRQAGGQRLTETGLSLGTPQYMSPEQATGDRVLDARSDVYSLGAVLYEMLAGDPPHTGSTVQAVIAKLVTERPTNLRVLRHAVPAGVEEAVMKALAKAPADRFTSAGAFASALAAGAAGRSPARTRALGKRIAVGVIALAAVAALGFWLADSARLGGAHAKISLHDHRQITSTGRAQRVAISADGKQLAFAPRGCHGPSCGIEIAEADGSAARRIVDSASAVDGMSWSPDRRNLLVNGTIAGRRGVYLVSTLGGSERLLTASGGAGFYANGDSLLLTPADSTDSVHWIRVAGLDGATHDSIRIAEAADGIFALSVPQTPWIVVLLGTSAGTELRVIDRRGRAIDRRIISPVNSFIAPYIRASGNAIWWVDDPSFALLRLALDAHSGKFVAAVDTVLSDSRYLSFDITADGGTLVAAVSAQRRDVYALDFPILARGESPPRTIVMHDVTTSIDVTISPDGSRLLIGPFTAFGWPSSERRLYTIPFAGGAESPLPTRGEVVAFGWADRSTIFIREREGRRARFVRMDARTGVRSDELVADSVAEGVGSLITPLAGGGWAWVPEDGQSIRVQQPSDATPRLIRKPEWYGFVSSVSGSPDGRRLAFMGFNAKGDSERVSVVPLAGGDPVAWLTAPYGQDGFQWLADGSMLWNVGVNGGRGFVHLQGPGRVVRLGQFAPPEGAPWAGTSVSADLKRAVLSRMYQHFDMWMWRVSPR